MLHRAFALAVVPTVPAVAVPLPAAAAPAVTAPVPPPLPPDPTATELAGRFAAVLKCEPGKKDPGRPLCAVTRIGKEPIWTPGQLSTYLGVSLKIPAGDLKKLGSMPLSVVALHLAAGSGRLQPVTAASEAEKPQLQALVNDLGGQLKGDKKDALAVPPELANRLRDERKKPRSPLKLDKGFAEFTGPAPSRLYRVDLAPVLGITTGPSPAFVTIEAAADGQQVSVFPATPLDR